MSSEALRPNAPRHVVEGRRLAPVLPSQVLGMLIFVLAEIMFFAGLISAYMIVKAGSVGSWPPPGQPRLPVEATAFNTAALLLSGVALLWARRAYRIAPERAVKPLLAAIALGACFVIFQGVEWVSLLGQGLTVTSSAHGSFFYLIVGAHALHAIAALVALAVVWAGLYQGKRVRNQFAGVQVFWYFVVGMWPIIYYKVYL
jgi:cytochrome c oxidase subunit 3